jgi:methyl-accepting chemotaxis protein
MKSILSSFQSWPMRQQLLCAVSLLLLPLGVLFYFNMDQVSYHIAFAGSEKLGNQSQRQMLQLLRQNPQTKAAIDMSALEAGSSDWLQQLQFPADFKRQVSELELRRRSGTEAEIQAWTQTLRGWIAKAGDSSNLTLDPEMDSYYLADVSSVVTAQTLDHLNRIRVFQSNVAQPSKSAIDWNQLAGLAAILDEADFQRIKGDIETACAENAKSSRGPSTTLCTNLKAKHAALETRQAEYMASLADLAKTKKTNPVQFELVDSSLRTALMELSQAVSVELDSLLDRRMEYYSSYRMKVIVGTAIALVVAIVILLMILGGISRALVTVTSQLERVSQKDLSVDFAEEHLARGDEIGQLARCAKTMVQNLSDVVENLQVSARQLIEVSAGLQQSSATMSSSTEETMNRSQSNAAAVEQMSANMGTIATATAQTSSGLDAVAASADSMAQGFSHLMGASDTARRTTNDASRQSSEIITQMERLSEAASAIGHVTETIKAISSQTNLLALNASIEAARAGAAGKGFAVVAGEIKQLAEQTAAATEDIRGRVETVQAAVGQGTEEISKVSSVVEGVRELVGQIATSIETQSTITRTITHSVSDAAQGLRDAKVRVEESSSVSTEIARDVAVVVQAARRINSESVSVEQQATGLSELAGRLNQAIAAFQLKTSSRK